MDSGSRWANNHWAGRSTRVRSSGCGTTGSSSHWRGSRRAAFGRGASSTLEGKPMSITPERQQTLIGEYALKTGDTGSPEVQVAILSERIRNPTHHLSRHQKEF